MKNKLFIVITGVALVGAAFLYSSAQKPDSDYKSVNSAVENSSTTTPDKKKTDQPVQKMQQKTQSTPAVRSNSTSTYKPYVAGVCTKTIIPRETEYVDSSRLESGQTKVYIEGADGFITHCTLDSNGNVSPSEGYKNEPRTRVIWRGTGLTAEQLRNQKINECVEYTRRTSPGSTAWQQCYTRL